MSLIAKEQGGAAISPVEEGTYPATCYALIDNGMQYSEIYNKTSRKFTLMWELEDEFITIDGKDEPRVVSKSYTLSLNEKSALRKDLVAWRGKEFTADELSGFDLTNILGAPCLLNIVHTTKDNRTYANIAGIMKLPKGMTAPVLVSKKIVFDLEESPLEMIDTFPEYMQKRIKESETYKARAAEPDEDYSVDPDSEETLPF